MRAESSDADVMSNAKRATRPWWMRRVSLRGERLMSEVGGSWN